MQAQTCATCSLKEALEGRIFRRSKEDKMMHFKYFTFDKSYFKHSKGTRKDTMVKAAFHGASICNDYFFSHGWNGMGSDQIRSVGGFDAVSRTWTD